MDKLRFARFVVRPNVNGGIVGINHGLFREGLVYEVVEVLGEYVIRELGPSPLGLPSSEAGERFGFCNGWTYDALYRNCGGHLVRTVDELSVTQDDPSCFCPATSEYDPPCPRHGVRPIGQRGDGSMVPVEHEHEHATDCGCRSCSGSY